MGPSQGVKTCFPMQLDPANFFVIRIGSLEKIHRRGADGIVNVRYEIEQKRKARNRLLEYLPE
jgi:hypothetical protein